MSDAPFSVKYPTMMRLDQRGHSWAGSWTPSQRAYESEYHHGNGRRPYTDEYDRQKDYSMDSPRGWSPSRSSLTQSASAPQLESPRTPNTPRSPRTPRDTSSHAPGGPDDVVWPRGAVVRAPRTSWLHPHGTKVLTPRGAVVRTPPTTPRRGYPAAAEYTPHPAAADGFALYGAESPPPNGLRTSGVRTYDHGGEGVYHHPQTSTHARIFASPRTDSGSTSSHSPHSLSPRTQSSPRSSPARSSSPLGGRPVTFGYPARRYAALHRDGRSVSEEAKDLSEELSAASWSPASREVGPRAHPLAARGTKLRNYSPSADDLASKAAYAPARRSTSPSNNLTTAASAAALSASRLLEKLPPDEAEEGDYPVMRDHEGRRICACACGR